MSLWLLLLAQKFGFFLVSFDNLQDLDITFFSSNAIYYSSEMWPFVINAFILLDGRSSTLVDFFIFFVLFKFIAFFFLVWCIFIPLFFM